MTARFVGPSAEADPVTRRAAYLYRADHAWPGAAPGTPVVAYVSSGPVARSAKEDVLVPDRAVVQWEGLAWAYVRRAPGRFQRVRVPTDRPATGGWIAGGGLAPGDSVVVTGAQELLSEEFRARVTVGDESGE
jgi:multidrug efflux pump subunit AcrA (membrane-fusion protein)